MSLSERLSAHGFDTSLIHGQLDAGEGDIRTVVDRREAIEMAVDLSEAGDVVLVAGKGHEKYQQIGYRVLPFDDGEVARAALARRRKRSSKAG